MKRWNIKKAHIVVNERFRLYGLWNSSRDRGWVRRWCATRGKKVSGQLRNCDRSKKDYVMVVTALSHKLSRHSGAV